MDLLSAFRLFVRTAESGSFSAVAREARISQPAVSQQIAMLESRVEGRLFHRSTRSLTLTDDGQELLKHARNVLDAVAEAEQALNRRHAGITGTVRIAVSPFFGRRWIAPSIARLLDAHPRLEVELLVDDGSQDLIAEGIDLAIRLGPIADTSMVMRRVGTVRRSAFASTEYLRSFGTPIHPNELHDHKCIVFVGTGGSHDQWSFLGPEGKIIVQVHGRFRCDSTDALREVILNGHGIGMLPDHYFSDEIKCGSVRAVPVGWHEPSQPVSLLYPSRRYLPPSVGAAIAFITARLLEATRSGVPADIRETNRDETSASSACI